MADKLEQEIDRLYQLPLADFTAARNKLAARIKRAGDAEGGERVRRLPKANLSAWLVNRLWRRSRRGLERLIEAGNELRSIQQGGTPEPDRLRRAMRQRKQALESLTARAETLLSETGEPTRVVLRRVEATLDAIATLGGAGAGQSLGRLSRDLEPPGFDALLALAPPPPRGKPGARSPKTKEKAAKSRDDDRIVRARTALRAAEENARGRAADAEMAEAARVRAEARMRKSKVELEAARRRIQEAKDGYDQAREAAKRARAAERRSGAARIRAEKAVEAARRAARRAEGARR